MSEDNKNNKKECKCNSCYKKLPKSEMVKQYKEGYQCENCHLWWKRVNYVIGGIVIFFLIGVIVYLFREENKRDK